MPAPSTVAMENSPACAQLRSAAPGPVPRLVASPGIRRCTTACLQQGDCPSIQWGPCQHVHSGMRAAHQLLPMLHLHMQRVVRVAVGQLANIQVCTPICHPPTSPGAHLPSCFPAMYVVPVSVSCGSCVLGELVLSCSDPGPLCVAGMVGHRRALHAAAVTLATGGCRRVWEKGEGTGVNLSFPTPHALSASAQHVACSDS